MKRHEAVIAFLLFCINSIHFAFPYEGDLCGDDPNIQRILSIGQEATDHFQVSVKLLSIQTNEGTPQILISVGKRIYSSKDNSLNWHREINASDCRQLTIAGNPGGCVISNSDPRTIYRPAVGVPHQSDLDRSRDGGRSWKLIHPMSVDGRHLGSVRIVGTGMRDPGRIYAEVTAVGERGLYVSENYGETFRSLIDWSGYLVESRANSKVLFSISKGIVVSIDEGAHWRLLDNGKTIFSPLFMDSRKLLRLGSHVRSWRKNTSNEEYGVNVEQIETDPINPAIIYVLSSKGLYRTMDAGKTFRLLPLGKDRVNEIQMIAVDPVDGRYLFAIVDGKDVFRSSDYGCSWQKLGLPD